MIVTQISNHVEQALARLIQQYKGRPLLAAVITAFVQQIQDLENALYPIAADRELANAVGQQLDNLGQIIGIERNGVSDAVYLTLLQGAIAENYSDTTLGVIEYIIETLFETSVVFVKTPNSYAGAQGGGSIGIGLGSSPIATSLYPIVEQIVLNSIGAGINLYYITSFNPSGVFAFAGPQSWPKGFGAYSYAPDPTVGGPWGTLIYNRPS